jgi:hypothetical protein
MARIGASDTDGFRFPRLLLNAMVLARIKNLISGIFRKSRHINHFQLTFVWLTNARVRLSTA